jgi:tRNA dimethylallyltransferase
MAPLIVITGPTASGKTGLALELAERYNGEIICADSRTIYRGMDIGTAKPTAKEQARVVHHGLDLVDPGQRFTARDFQAMAWKAIADIRSRNKIPFLVGGTGLYIDAVVLEFQWPEQAIETKHFDSMSNEQLQAMIKKQHIDMPVNTANPRHLINALKRNGRQGERLPGPRENTHVVAIATDRETLQLRIRQRAEVMFESGVIDEATRLAETFGWQNEAMSSNIYPIIKRLQDGEIDRQQAIELFARRDWQLARRQLTWLRRHDYVEWLSLDEAGRHIETILTDVC